MRRVGRRRLGYGQRLFTIGPALDERQDQPQQAQDCRASQQANSTYRCLLPAVHQSDDDSADDDQENRDDHDESAFVLAPERTQIGDGMRFVWHQYLPGPKLVWMNDSFLRRLRLYFAGMFARLQEDYSCAWEAVKPGLGVSTWGRASAHDLNTLGAGEFYRLKPWLLNAETVPTPNAFDSMLATP
jgi:hypothetical protein